MYICLNVYVPVYERVWTHVCESVLVLFCVCVCERARRVCATGVRECVCVRVGSSYQTNPAEEANDSNIKQSIELKLRRKPYYSKHEIDNQRNEEIAANTHKLADRYIEHWFTTQPFDERVRNGRPRTEHKQRGRIGQMLTKYIAICSRLSILKLSQHG